MIFDIDHEIDLLISREGEYSDDPADKGGKTKYGVTEAVARAYGYQGEMKDLTRPTAVAIFKLRYWVEPSFDKIAGVSNGIAGELFDTGVNMGTAIASKFLQRALNVLNQQAQSWPEVGMDGRIGPQSFFALKQYLIQRGAPGESVMLRLLNAQQAVRYLEIAEANPSQERFEFGWILNRVM